MRQERSASVGNTLAVPPFGTLWSAARKIELTRMDKKPNWELPLRARVRSSGKPPEPRQNPGTIRCFRGSYEAARRKCK